MARAGQQTSPRRRSGGNGWARAPRPREPVRPRSRAMSVCWPFGDDAALSSRRVSRARPRPACRPVRPRRARYGRSPPLFHNCSPARRTRAAYAGSGARAADPVRRTTAEPSTNRSQRVHDPRAAAHLQVDRRTTARSPPSGWTAGGRPPAALPAHWPAPASRARLPLLEAHCASSRAPARAPSGAVTAITTSRNAAPSKPPARPLPAPPRAGPQRPRSRRPLSCDRCTAWLATARPEPSARILRMTSLLRRKTWKGPASCGMTAGRGVRAATASTSGSPRPRHFHAEGDTRSGPEARFGEPHGKAVRPCGTASARRLARPAARPLARLRSERVCWPQVPACPPRAHARSGCGAAAAGTPSHGTKPKGASGDGAAETPLRRNGLASGATP